MHSILVAFLTSSAFVAGADGATSGTLFVQSAAFGDNQPIPRTLTCQGDNKSPPLSWSNVPPQATSIAILVDDPDAPQGPFTHWIVVNLPPTLTALKTGSRVPMGAFSTHYRGPCPPTGTHHYRFHVYALDVMLPHVQDRGAFLQAVEGHVLADGVLVGTYDKQR